jgi:argininosuccinate lyase
VSLSALTMAHAEFDRERMRERAASEWITVTELADVLVRDRGLSFHAAHSIVSRFVALARVPGTSAGADLLAAAAGQVGHTVQYSDEELRSILSPANFVSVRRTPGGPAPDIVAAALRTADDRLTEDAAALAAARSGLARAETERRRAVDAL